MENIDECFINMFNSRKLEKERILLILNNKCDLYKYLNNDNSKNKEHYFDEDIINLILTKNGDLYEFIPEVMKKDKKYCLLGALNTSNINYFFEICDKEIFNSEVFKTEYLLFYKDKLHLKGFDQTEIFHINTLGDLFNIKEMSSELKLNYFTIKVVIESKVRNFYTKI